MAFTVLFFTELLTLFLLSRSLSRALSFLFYKITKKQKLTVYLMSFLFLPGTIIHELSHAFMATLLFVRIHRMEFVPKIDGNTVKLGSVSIEKSNIIKSLLIGMAPFIFGSTILMGIFYASAHFRLFENYFFIILMLYLSFAIGNTMFSSKKDMEGAIEILVTLCVITLILYLVGFRIPAIDLDTFLQAPLITTTFQKGSFFLLVPIALDLVILLLIRLVAGKRL